MRQNKLKMGEMLLRKIIGFLFTMPRDIAFLYKKHLCNVSCGYFSKHTFLDNLGKNSIVVDLGAYKGHFSRAILKKHPYSKCILVEANPDLAKDLRKSFRTYRKVKVINAVVGAKSQKKVRFYIHENLQSSSLYDALVQQDKVLNKNHIEVKMITLNDIFLYSESPKINLLKMNIEGAEWNILENFSKRDFERIEQITVSFHDFIYPVYRKRTKACIGKLKELGYSFLNRGSVIHPYIDCLFYKK